MSNVISNSALLQDWMNAQVGVLGSMLIDEDCVSKVLSCVSTKDFREMQYRSIFQVIQQLFRAGLPTDPITVREKLGGSQWTELLAGLMELTPTSASVDGYISLLKESSVLFQLKEIGERLQDATDLDEARNLLDNAMKLQISRPGIEALTFAQGYEQFFELHDGETEVDALEWDIHELNSVLKVKPGNMVIIGGYPSDGKTAFALQCAARFGLKHKVGYFSFESTNDQLFDRHVSRVALISSKSIAENAISEQSYGDLVALKDRITAPQVTIIDAAGMTALDIEAYSQSHHFDVVMLDYLQKVKGSEGRRMAEYDRVTEVSGAMQEFAKRTKKRVVALSQLSRPDKGKDGKIRAPVMGDLRSSGQIEQDADVILFVYREDYRLKDSPRIIQVAKNRNGEAFDRVRCRFDGDHQTFARIAPIPEPPRERQKPRQQSFWGDGSDWTELKKADTPFSQEVENGNR